MKSSDIFEFIDYKRERSQPQHEFYDETLERWISVNDNIFVCLAHVKNVEWKDSRYDRSLYFTDGNCIFHMRVDVTFSSSLAVGASATFFMRVM